MMTDSDKTKLVKTPDLITMKNTLFVGKVLHYFEHIGSTNAAAAQFLTQNTELANPVVRAVVPLAEGSVFLTFNQTAGRGQMGNRWESIAGENIAISFLFLPHFLAPHEQFLLNKAITLAINDFFTPFLSSEKKLRIKWPNDIYVNDRKICGILIQNTLAASHIQAAIIGIGLNINQKIFDNLPHATSLFLETNQLFDLSNLVEKLCQAVEQQYLRLKTRQFGSLNLDYLSKLYHFGEESLFQRLDGRYFSGTIAGVTVAGRLSIELKNSGGVVEDFDLKEVKFVMI